jgi:glycopeptide antibiotics resistance protein
MPRSLPTSRVLLLAWIAGLAVLALLPFGAVSGREPASWVASVPFDTIVHALRRGLTVATFLSVVGNVAAFVPIGLLAPMTSPRWRSWVTALGLGLMMSLAIEATQLAVSIAVGIPYRRADVDDLILNGLGTAIGYGAWRLLALSRRGRAPARSA